MITIHGSPSEIQLMNLSKYYFLCLMNICPNACNCIVKSWLRIPIHIYYFYNLWFVCHLISYILNCVPYLRNHTFKGNSGIMLDWISNWSRLNLPSHLTWCNQHKIPLFQYCAFHYFIHIYTFVWCFNLFFYYCYSFLFFVSVCFGIFLGLEDRVSN